MRAKGLKVEFRTLDTTSSEHDHQAKVMDWLEGKGYDCFHVPNTYALISSLPLHRKMMYTSKMNEAGVRPGVPDIIILNKSKLTGNQVVVEMKKIPCKDLSKHKLPCNCMSDEQKEWKDKFLKHGWTHILAHGSDDAIESLEKLGY